MTPVCLESDHPCCALYSTALQGSPANYGSFNCKSRSGTSFAGRPAAYSKCRSSERRSGLPVQEPRCTSIPATGPKVGTLHFWKYTHSFFVAKVSSLLLFLSGRVSRAIARLLVQGSHNLQRSARPLNEHRLKGAGPIPSSAVPSHVVPLVRRKVRLLVPLMISKQRACDACTQAHNSAEHQHQKGT